MSPNLIPASILVMRMIRPSPPMVIRLSMFTIREMSILLRLNIEQVVEAGLIHMCGTPILLLH